MSFRTTVFLSMLQDAVALRTDILSGMQQKQGLPPFKLKCGFN